jgi:PEP-CTERM motif
MSRKLLVPLFAMAVSMWAVAAQATVVTYDYDFVFSGSVPDSTSPYLYATFYSGTDCGLIGETCGTGVVELVLTSSLEDSSEFVTEWDFNSSVLPLTITYDTTNNLNYGTYGIPVQGANNAPTIGTGFDGFQAGGDGKYDISFVFASANADRFNGVDRAVFTITGTGITAGTFSGLAAQGGAAGPFHTAAHLQGINQTCSGWVSDQSGNTSGLTGPCTTTVPEPTSLSMFLSGLGLVGAFGISRRRSLPVA